MRRLLFGPVDAAFAGRYLSDWRASGRCRTFGPGGDIPDPASGRWRDVAERIGPDWRPDAVVLWLPYSSIPAWVWEAPVPVIGLAGDWNLLWHSYRHTLPLCDAFLTDGPGLAVCRRAGISHGHQANLYGLGRDHLDGPLPDPRGLRDIDVLFVGNLNPAVQPERLPFLARVARLSARRRVLVATGVFGRDYRALLARSKIVFNRSIRGEANQRAFEAAAGGAMLLQESGNQELAGFMTPGEQYQTYGDGDLEAVVDHWLDRPDERVAIAAAAQGLAAQCSFASLLDRGLSSVASDAAAVAARVVRRTASGFRPSLAARTWQRASLSYADHDPCLRKDLEADGAWYEAACCTRDVSEQSKLLTREVRRGLARFAAATVAEAQGEGDRAVTLLSGLLDRLNLAGTLDSADVDAIPFPVGFDWLRVEWEKAAWQNPADPAAESESKWELLRWAVNAKLAGLTGNLDRFREAVVAGPRIPSTRAALGCALARSGDLPGALPHLRAAVLANPFDVKAARALYQALSDCGELLAAAAVARDRALLHHAVPSLGEVEPWMNAA